MATRDACGPTGFNHILRTIDPDTNDVRASQWPNLGALNTRTGAYQGSDQLTRITHSAFCDERFQMEDLDYYNPLIPFVREFRSFVLRSAAVFPHTSLMNSISVARELRDAIVLKIPSSQCSNRTGLSSDSQPRGCKRGGGASRTSSATAPLSCFCPLALSFEGDSQAQGRKRRDTLPKRSP